MAARPAPLVPLRWSAEQLEACRVQAIAHFRSERLTEERATYERCFAADIAAVEALFAASDDLLALGGRLEAVLADQQGLRTLRYLAAPPVSEDDLAVLVADDAQGPARDALRPARLRRDPALRERLHAVLRQVLDARRFPWLAAQRPPAADERAAGVLATAALMASAQLQTLRRNLGKERQEEAVRQGLLARGFREVPRRRIDTVAMAPQPGEFCLESLLGTRKADLVVGLWDRRLLPIECKVSNSALNSIKRLNNDAAAKARRWLSEFGELQVTPTAVLSGVFDLANLQRAQDDRLTLVWAHRLDDLLAWIEGTRSG